MKSWCSLQFLDLQNISAGKELIESFMKEVNDEGVKELAPWNPKDVAANLELRRIVSRGTELPKGQSQPGQWHLHDDFYFQQLFF